LVEDYGLPTDGSAQNALDALEHLDLKDSDTPNKLLELKQRFALGWSALSLSPDADFRTLGDLQSQFAARSIDAYLFSASASLAD